MALRGAAGTVVRRGWILHILLKSQKYFLVNSKWSEKKEARFLSGECTVFNDMRKTVRVIGGRRQGVGKFCV